MISADSLRASVTRRLLRLGLRFMTLAWNYPQSSMRGACIRGLARGGITAVSALAHSFGYMLRFVSESNANRRDQVGQRNATPMADVLVDKEGFGAVRLGYNHTLEILAQGQAIQLAEAQYWSLMEMLSEAAQKLVARNNQFVKGSSR